MKKNLHPAQATLARTLLQTTRSCIKATAILAVLLPATGHAQATDTLFSVRDSSKVRMSLYKTGGFALTGPIDSSTTGANIPMAGPGNRMMWYPEKAALRAGYITGTQWDDVNTGFYSFAAGESVRASGDYSVAMGARCVAAQTSSFAIGEQSTASGAASVAMGYHAHTNARQGSFVFADRSTVDTLRAGVNHSANWRVSGGFRIFTSSNLSTGVTLQSGASVSNWGQSSAVISTSTGALLTTGGVWTNASDVNRKHLFETISGEDILQRLRKLPITRWSYRSEDDKIKHIGPMAQDFYATFGLGNDNRSIGTVDADGIALAGVQALDARTGKLTSELETLKAENAALRSRLDALEKPSGMTSAGLPMILVLAGAGLVGLLLRRRTAVKG